MKHLVFAASILFSTVALHAQSVVGKWQLVKQSSCIEDDVPMDESGVEDVIADMKEMGAPPPQVLILKENATGEENTKVLSKKKNYNHKSFLYRFNGDGLYILDKRSRTIVEGFTVEKLSADSLILSHSARPCDTRVFVKIN